jgi:hypothetical protein
LGYSVGGGHGQGQKVGLSSVGDIGRDNTAVNALFKKQLQIQTKTYLDCMKESGTIPEKWIIKNRRKMSRSAGTGSIGGRITVYSLQF